MVKVLSVVAYCLSFIGYFLQVVGKAWCAGMGEENDIKLLSFKEHVNWKLNDESSCLVCCCHHKGDILYSTVRIIACTVWQELLLVSLSCWSLLT